MPREGRNRREYYRNKFGDERLKNLRQALNSAGAEEGIVFGDEPDAVAPNTLSAHVLMFWASNDQSIDHNALAERLFLAHHVTCENIGDHEVLARIAGEVGMDGAGVMSKLAAGDNENDVQEQIHRSAARGISGVPFFIINGQYGISGAQPVDILLSTFDQIAKSS
jgi:predicted DsbA family dithiol-disulfide isomerase